MLTRLTPVATLVTVGVLQYSDVGMQRNSQSQ